MRASNVPSTPARATGEKRKEKREKRRPALSSFLFPLSSFLFSPDEGMALGL
jgi:hypothetical protein